MEDDNISLFIFDHDFYINTYTDLDKNKYDTKDKSLAHYIRWGKYEGRRCSKDEMLYYYHKNKQEALEKLKNFPIITDVFFSILIRTSNRPEYFKKCIESVLNQTYQNFKVFICYDDINSLDYLIEHDKNSKVNFFPVKEYSKEKYKFNLYCNSLLKQVKTGYIIFIDDDNQFLSDRALEMINWCSQDYKIITWNFLRPDRLIKKTNLSTPLILGEIDTSNVCFCSSLKDNSKWLDKQYGDFNYFKPLFDNCEENDKFYFDYTLTATQFNDKIGNFGKN